MKKAASIFLRAEIEPRDIELLIRWMENPHITQYLNEEPSVIRSLRQLLLTVPSPMLTFHFNRLGRFFLICRSNGNTIGFVKLRELSERGSYEIVYAIGEESLWGHGYGERLEHCDADFAGSFRPFGAGRYGQSKNSARSSYTASKKTMRQNPCMKVCAFPASEKQT